MWNEYEDRIAWDDLAPSLQELISKGLYTISKFPDFSLFALKTDLDNYTKKTELPDLNIYETIAHAESTYVEKTQLPDFSLYELHSYADDTYAKKTEIPTVSQYTLPMASSTTLGGVKIGSGISIAGDGKISVTANSIVDLTPINTETYYTRDITYNTYYGTETETVTFLKESKKGYLAYFSNGSTAEKLIEHISHTQAEADAYFNDWKERQEQLYLNCDTPEDCECQDCDEIGSDCMSDMDCAGDD
jgi:hypothetical protein